MLTGVQHPPAAGWRVAGDDCFRTSGRGSFSTHGQANKINSMLVGGAGLGTNRDTMTCLGVVMSSQRPMAMAREHSKPYDNSVCVSYHC